MSPTELEPTITADLPRLAVALRTALAAQVPAAVRLRQAVHANPELSGQETATAARVAREITDAAPDEAVPGQPVGGTGRLLRVGAGDGPIVALRAELDALPVIERTAVPWRARGTVMHACGHDVHLAGLAALGRALRRVPDAPAALLMLQPREEVSDSGATDVLASGVLQRLDIRSVVGVHVQPRLPGGTVCVTPGPVNAAVDEFRVQVDGVGGHGGYPHTTADPVLALAAVVVSLQQVVSRRVDPTDGAVCTVGTLAAGTTHNVIPGTATASGTLRSMSEQTQAELRDVVTQVCVATAAGYGCSATVHWGAPEPVLRNDPALAAASGAWLREFGIPVDERWRSFGADDFAFYGRVLPSLMAFAGVAPPPGWEDEPPPGLHSPFFVPGDEVVDLVAHAYLAGYLAALAVGAGA